MVVLLVKKITYTPPDVQIISTLVNCGGRLAMFIHSGRANKWLEGDNI